MTFYRHQNSKPVRRISLRKLLVIFIIVTMALLFLRNEQHPRECNKITDSDEYQRCMDEGNTAYKVDDRQAQRL